MNLSKFIVYMAFATILCWVGFFMILLFMSPAESGKLTFLLFYLILGMSALGTFTIFGFWIRRIFSANELSFYNVIVSFRQGLWLSMVLTVSLYLQSKGLLNWINAVLFILSLSLIEFFCLNYQDNSHDTLE